MAAPYSQTTRSRLIHVVPSTAFSSPEMVARASRPSLAIGLIIPVVECCRRLVRDEDLQRHGEQRRQSTLGRGQQGSGILLF